MKAVIDFDSFKNHMYMNYVSDYTHTESNANYLTQTEYYEKYDDFLKREYEEHYGQKQEVSDV